MQIKVLGAEKRIIITPLDGQKEVLWSIISEEDSVLVKEGVSRLGKEGAIIDCSDLKLWSPEDPNMYRIKISGDDKWQRFGLIDLKASQDHIYLNGSPYYIRGFIRGLKAHEHENFISPNEREFHEKNVRMAKAYGFNYVRWHSTIPDETFLDVADTLGILVHIEFGFKVIWGKDADGGNIVLSIEFNEDEIRRIVSKLSTHPSVAVYCLGNEIHNSGTRPEVKRLVEIIKEMDPSKLVMDNCGWGEFDRDTSDFYCQHMGYYFPFDTHRNMFNVKEVFRLDGSVKGPVSYSGDGTFHDTINVNKPVVAHEVLHYISWHDIDKLNADFENKEVNVNRLPKPWWIEEIKNLQKVKGIEGERQKQILKASRQFTSICAKEAVEQLRKSQFLQGFMMLQLADTNRYENGNGLLDCFDNPKFISAEKWRKINDDVVLLVDLPERSLKSGEEHEFHLYISNYSRAGEFNYGDLKLELLKEEALLKMFSCKNVKVQRKGVYELGSFVMTLPEVSRPEKLTLRVQLNTEDGRVFDNSWNIWVFPVKKAISIENGTSGDGVVITTSLNEGLLDDIANGSCVLCLYNPELFPRREDDLYFPYVRDHFKPVIWDRGHQMGGIIRENDALRDFPHDGVVDFQFARLIEKAVKINLDDFPVNIEPIIEGIDRPVRDRMLVISKRDSTFNPAYYMRKFGYLFELRIGKGTLLVCTFKFNDSYVESNYMLSCLLEYMESRKGHGTEVSLDQLKDFLKKSPKNGRIFEPPMNEYWERDNEPVETKLFWEEVGIDITKL